MPKENIPINKQEAQLMLTNPRDAVRGQPRSPNIVDNWLQKCHDLENRVRGPSRSLEIFHRVHTTYFLFTIYSNYGSISCRFWDIQCRKMSWP